MDSEPLYIKYFLKTKIKFYNDKATDLYDKQMLRVGSSCLAVILIALEKDGKSYPQVFPKESKYFQKKEGD